MMLWQTCGASKATAGALRVAQLYLAGGLADALTLNP